MNYKPLQIGELIAERPIVQGGMGVGISLGNLAGAVAKEGGVGIISSAQIGFKEEDFENNPRLANKKAIKKEYEKARRISPNGIIGFNIMVALKDYREHVIEAAKAGADIIECNFSCPQMVGEGLGSDVGTDPQLVAKYTAATKKGTTLPVLAKMTPNITKMEVPAEAAVRAGADGLAAINTIKSVMNINLQTFSSAPDVDGKSPEGGYSGKAVKPIALRFINDMAKDENLKGVPISGMGGIETWRDAAEFLALGCETVQVTTSVMQYGYRIIEDMIGGMQDYLAQNGMTSVRQMIGKALPNIVPAESVNRRTIEYPKFNRRICVGCGRCYISCFDGGHQALRMDEKRQPLMDAKKCVGCQLCKLVCPTGSITAGTRVEKRK